MDLVINAGLLITMGSRWFSLCAGQIIPPASRLTLDIPKMSLSFEDNSNSAWKWWFHERHFSVPEDSTVVADIECLQTTTSTWITGRTQEEISSRIRLG